jgi:hypothetical protein
MGKGMLSSWKTEFMSVNDVWIEVGYDGSKHNEDHSHTYPFVQPTCCELQRSTPSSIPPYLHA